METKTEILNARQIQQKLNRLAFEIYENNLEEKEILLAGIMGNGYLMAQRLEEILGQICPLPVRLGKIELDKDNPLSGPVTCDFTEKDYKNKSVVVVDDVLNSGKTLIFAVKVFLEKPVKKIQTVVMVDRSYKRFPIKGDFVGISLSTSLQEHVVADFSEKGKETVYLT